MATHGPGRPPGLAVAWIAIGSNGTGTALLLRRGVSAARPVAARRTMVFGLSLPRELTRPPSHLPLAAQGVPGNSRGGDASWIMACGGGSCQEPAGGIACGIWMCPQRHMVMRPTPMWAWGMASGSVQRSLHPPSSIPHPHPHSLGRATDTPFGSPSPPPSGL